MTTEPLAASLPAAGLCCTAADAPDIDGKIFIKSSNRLRLGQYILVEVFDTMDYDLQAEEVENA